MIRRVAILLIIGIAITAIIVVHYTDDGSTTGDLTKQKVTELARYGITPQQYMRAQKHAEAYKAALDREPPPDPNVVGPRLLREEHGPELMAWKNVYSARTHDAVEERWSVQQVGEKRTIVTLQLISGLYTVLGPASWAMNFSLTHPLTPAEEHVANGPRGVEALNSIARKLETLPLPRTGRDLPVSIFAFEVLSPGLHKIIVEVSPTSNYYPKLIMRTGTLDESLLRGKILARHRPESEQFLKLGKKVKIFIEPFVDTKTRVRRRSSVYALNRLFKKGPVPLILGWRSGAHNLYDLLRRPVQELIILSS